MPSIIALKGIKKETLMIIMIMIMIIVMMMELCKARTKTFQNSRANKVKSVEKRS